jgi:hypothetical protein
MMFSLFSALKALDVKVPVLHTYNINCQFVKNLWTRFQTLPKELRHLNIPKDWFTHLIPKMHLMGHTRCCQAPYSLNFAHGACRTCSEAIERMWALIVGILLSVREMGPGMRSDWLDHHMGNHNWRKQCRTGQFASRLMESPRADPIS